MSLCMAYYNFFFLLSNEFYSILFIFNNKPELIAISRFRKTTVLILCKKFKLPSNPHLFQVLFSQYSRSVSIVCVMHLKCVLCCMINWVYLFGLSLKMVVWIIKCTLFSTNENHSCCYIGPEKEKKERKYNEKTTKIKWNSKWMAE